ncbi:glycosyltransferase WbuB [Chromohalobacter japonicus]|uniref:Glycosyltransferase WbuB n=1 Tax=Chromohalobacter japonicus TaxID=223900 RepID=A0A1Q8T970_9GAMM|nr:glycosyltransferase family 4 protein [Chromohalobacter japonicus]OLO10225.1 glycosyltransferase WbuB [Chromohalobacter japonicus]
MRILYLHQYFNTPEMSGGTRSYEMARRMVAAGHEVHMLTSYREKGYQSDWFTTNEAGIQVHWFPVPYSNHMSYGQRIKAFFAFAFAARQKALSLEGDIVFATSTPLTIALPGVLAARKHQIPMVFEVRDLWPEVPIAIGALKNPIMRFGARWLERWAYRHSSSVVALSPGMKQGIVSTGYPASRVAVIPNSSDNHEFQHDQQAAVAFRSERPWLGSRPLLVYAGTFGKINGVGYMVELASALQERGSDICFLLVGDGQERPAVIEAAQEAGVYEKNMFFESVIPKREIPALLSAATIASNLVIDLPAARANSANKFFDSLAAGKPVLINHGGWMHELIKAHGCGLAMWETPVEKVAEELDEKLHDSVWLDQAGAAAKVLAEQEFDREVLANQLIQVMETTLEGDPSRAAEIAPGNYSY